MSTFILSGVSIPAAQYDMIDEDSAEYAEYMLAGWADDEDMD